MATITIEKDDAVRLGEYLSKEKAVLDHTLSEEFNDHYAKAYGEDIPGWILARERANRDLIERVMGAIVEAVKEGVA